jgi:hypothetical protein
LMFLRNVFRQNGYDQQIHRVLNRHPNICQPDDNPISVIFLPYVGTIFNRISRVLSRHNRSVGLPPKKISGFLRPVKDNLGLRTPGVYRIPCGCGSVYIVQTGRSVDARLKEHQRHIRLEHPNKSAMAEHSVDLGHHIQFHNTSILATDTQYMVASLGRPLKLSSITTVWTEKWVFVSASHGSCSSAPSRNLRNMMPDLLGHARPCTLGSLVPRLLGQCQLSIPSLSPLPLHASILALACYLLAHPSLLISHVAHSPSLPVLT